MSFVRKVERKTVVRIRALQFMLRYFTLIATFMFFCFLFGKVLPQFATILTDAIKDVLLFFDMNC